MYFVFPAQQLAAFEAICSQMLEDVQERLVYRTHIYIRSEILHYAPAQGDLAYPEKLHMMEVQIKIYIDYPASKHDKSFFLKVILLLE